MTLFGGIPKKRVMLDLCFSSVWALCECILMTFLSDLAGMMGNNDTALVAGVVFLIGIAAWELLEFIADIHSQLTIEYINANSYLNSLQELYTIRPDIIRKNNSGYISGLIGKYASNRGALYSDLVLFVPTSAVFVFYFTINLISYHWLYSIEFFFICTLCVAFKGFTRKFAKKVCDDYIETDSQRNRLEIDALCNMNTIQKMQAIDFFEDAFEKENKAVIKKAFSMHKWLEISLCGFKFLGYLFTPLAIATFMLIKDTSNIISFAAIIGLLTVKIIHSVKSLANVFNKKDKYDSSKEKLQKILNPKNKRDMELIKKFDLIELKDVDYSYAQKKNKTVRVQIPHFEVRKGDKICIYGESGQGKTTLLNLLSKQINESNIYVDGKIQAGRLDCVFISQDTEMFDLSLRDNLKLGNNNITDEKIISYLNKVGLGKWLSSQKDGLDTILGERGTFVSTGQRQRLNLVRGLLIEDKEIYLLDEPTSNVDEKVEEDMISLIKEVLNNKTVIVVTHRPKIKKICNKAYEFSNGICRLVE